MTNDPVSPAVASLLEEQAQQTAKRKSRLDKGLEDTFPASDPVSVTHTSTATTTSASDEPSADVEALGLHPVDTELRFDAKAGSPDVDDTQATHFQTMQLDALRREVQNLRDHIHGAASIAAQTAAATAGALSQRVQGALDREPFIVVGATAAISYVIGAMHAAKLRRDR